MTTDQKLDQTTPTVPDQSTEELFEAIDKDEVEFVSEVDEEAPPAKPEKPAAETYTIVHNGVEHNFDRAKIVEFAQKGFDYDTKVGPHRKLVQLIDSDPEAQAILNTHFSRKMGLVPPAPPIQPQAPPPPPQQQSLDLSKVELTPLRNYEDEKVWFRENMQKVLDVALSQRMAPPVPQSPVPPQTQRVAGPVQMIQRHDPLHFQQVIPRIDEFANQLSVPEYRKITSSIPDFLAFYDEVKARVLSTPPDTVPNNPQGIVNQGTPQPRRFNLKPSGTPAPKKGKQTVNIWDLKNDDFDALVNRMVNKN